MGRGEVVWGAEEWRFFSLFFKKKKIQICYLMDPKEKKSEAKQNQNKQKSPLQIFFFPGHRLLCLLSRSRFNININTMCSLKLVPL